MIRPPPGTFSSRCWRSTATGAYRPRPPRKHGTVSRPPATGTGLRRRVLHVRNAARDRVHLRGRGDGRADHGAVEFGTRRGARIGGDIGAAVSTRILAFHAAHLRTRIGAVHL